MKKNPANITDAELLSLLEDLEDGDLEIEPAFDSSVLSFVHSFNLKPGKDRVVKKQLHSLYKVWNKGLTKLSQKQFTNEITKYLGQDTHYYLIDKSLFTVADFIKTEKSRRGLDRSKSKTWHTHFTSFLNDTGLKEGTVFIELEILYFLYGQWAHYTRKTRLGSKTFLKILDIYFDVKAIGPSNFLWVGLNEQIKNLITKQEVERWRKNRDKKIKRYYYPQKEWRKFALYWEEKTKSKGND